MGYKIFLLMGRDSAYVLLSGMSPWCILANMALVGILLGVWGLDMALRGSVFFFFLASSCIYHVLLSITRVVSEIRDLLRSIHKDYSAHPHELITEQSTSLKRNFMMYFRASRLSSQLDKQASIYKLPRHVQNFRGWQHSINLIGLLV